jgi:hypothetical protein
MAVPKKVEEKKEEKVREKSATNAPEVKEEIVAEEVVIKTPGPVEIIEEAPKEEKAMEEKTQEKVKDKVPADPLIEFKERMNREEYAGFEAPKKKNFMWPILIIFVIAILLLVGIFIYKNGARINAVKEEIVKTKVTPTVTPEPTKAIDLTKYEIEVLNGSGVDGQASKEKAALEEAGFTISSIGNADNSNYTDTVIKAKADVDKAFIGKLKTTLESSFTVGSAETLSSDSSVPVVVIIGTQK